MTYRQQIKADRRAAAAERRCPQARREEARVEALYTDEYALQRHAARRGQQLPTELVVYPDLLLR